MKKMILIALFLIALGAAFFSGLQIYDFYHTQEVNNQQYEDLKKEYSVDVENVPVSEESSSETTHENGSKKSPYDFGKLKQENEDIRGWIKIPDSLIDFPVVQGFDNSHYLSYGFDGNYNQNGCPFLDYRTKQTDNNNVIHGHNMGTGSTPMFSTLIKYDDFDYYKKHEYFYYSSVFNSENIDKYRIISVIHFYINDLSSFDYMQRKFETTKEINDWIKKANSLSIYQITAPVVDRLEERQIVTLSTCDRREYGQSGRYLIVGIKENP